jgi:hypothetical protein
MLGEEQRIVDKHVLAKVFRIYHIRETKANQVEMSDAKVALVNIIDTFLDTYNTYEGWVAKKMKSKYANKFVAILPIIYQKDKV